MQFFRQFLIYGVAILMVVGLLHYTNFDPRVLGTISPLHIGLIGGLTFLLLLHNAIGLVIFMSLFRYTISFFEAWHISQFYSLLNYLPLKAGLIGEAAHLKMRYGFPINTFVLGTVVIYALNFLAYGLLSAGAFVFVDPTVFRTFVEGINVPLLLFLGGVGILLLLVFFFAPLTFSNGNKYTAHLNLLLQHRKELWRARGTLVWFFALISVGIIIFALRLMASFAAVGAPVSIPLAIILAVAAQFAFLFSITPAGLGVREAFLGGLTFLVLGDSGVGVAVALLNRLFDVAFVGIVGGLSFIRMRQTDMFSELKHPYVQGRNGEEI
jgi:uncharacterized membrane protein YbhN (UPF0104 family)